MSALVTVLARAPSRFVGFLPALLLAAVCAKAVELVLYLPPQDERGAVVGLALGLELLALARAVPWLFLLSVPLLAMESGRARHLAVAVAWTVLVVADVALMQYFVTTRVPLGADLFGYSGAEIEQTFSGGAPFGAAMLLHFAAPLACLWTALFVLADRPWEPPAAAAFAVVAAGLVAAFAAPGQAQVADWARADPVVVDKVSYFVEDTLRWVGRRRAAASAVSAAAPQPPGLPSPADPRFPFLHAEQTPDVLGPLLRDAGGPPNLVFVVVEGLGRSFSGPDARHGSFTPFLDELAGRSLYFENFLANQGRTFAALPTIFGSLPFGDVGFAALAEDRPLPPHVTLLGILGAQGYHARFYAGFDLAFDHERRFLEAQHVESIVDSHDFGGAYRRANSWGYGDGELVARTLAGEARAAQQPAVLVVQTVTLHTPYTFPEQAAYRARLERRLDELKVPAEDRAEYRRFARIYTSILYTDDALRTLVEGLAAMPAWPRTILVLTGDHCLPELPMATRIERYHVPLVIASPLLKAPARIKAVSSQMDLAPSLLAYLAHGYGLRSPEQVTWLGTGLDVAAGFRNVHDVPLKLAKHLLADFVQGPWYLSRGELFRLGDGMTEDPADDAAAAARLGETLQKFVAANDRLAVSGALMPASALPSWAGYREDRRMAAAPPAGAPAEAPAIAVTAIQVPAEAQRGELYVDAEFTNRGARAAPRFVPMALVLSGKGQQLTETYGEPLALAPGQAARLSLHVKSRSLPPGQYFVAVIPSSPATGKAVGAGRYHLPVRLR